MSTRSPRRIWLCADDYGISPGVNRSIRELIGQRRLNATSVMVVGHAIGHDEAAALQTAVADNPGCAIGLHVTLTMPFVPLTMYFRPLPGGLFPPLGSMLAKSMLRRLDTEIIRAEIAAQLAAFIALFGRTPDYVDGHQHVHIFPQVRDAFLSAVKAAAPNAWVRQCGRNHLPLGERLNTPKALLLDFLSSGFRKRATTNGISFNPGFAGAYDFAQQTDFAALMQGFLTNMPEGGLVMCHPGYVDDVLVRLDPLTDQREREHNFLASDAFAQLLTKTGVTLS